MNTCPFHRVRAFISHGSKFLSKDLLMSPTEEDKKKSMESYELLGGIISEIFPESFFETEIEHEAFSWVWPIDANTIFQKQGEARIRDFFQKERERWFTHPWREWMKFYPTSLEETIKKWWWHACYIIAVFLNHILREKRTEIEYKDFLREAEKILILLWRQHLNIETWFVLNIDQILARRTHLDTVYDSTDKLSNTDLPALWCPALFFGDKRVAGSLFDWMSRGMMRSYKNKSSTRIIGEKIGLWFQKVLSNMNKNQI